MSFDCTLPNANGDITEGVRKTPTPPQNGSPEIPSPSLLLLLRHGRLFVAPNPKLSPNQNPQNGFFRDSQKPLQPKTSPKPPPEENSMSIFTVTATAGAGASISPTFRRTPPQICCGLRELRERIDSVKNTQKITEAMKLVAAAKIRRAQEAVVNGRPFAETLVEVLYDINDRLQSDDIDFPLTTARPVKKIAVVVFTGNRGLCGGCNNAVIRKAEARIEEIKRLGLDYALISVGKKGNLYFSRNPNPNLEKLIEIGNFPTVKEAQIIADHVFSLFVSEEVDKVELVYTKFVSLIKFDPVIQTLLPLQGKVFNVNGNSVDAMEDEFFRLSSKQGKLSVEREIGMKKRDKTGEFLSPVMEFEQDPVQILDALMPLYLNSQVLRALQEAVASELAARMNAMSSATDNAVELQKGLLRTYNRERQAKITGEILEIVAGAEALAELE